ncbi:5-azacytidine resistance protein azr1, putative [Pediculus humanus corporis]|uniref:Protein phosphatase n=1 Tax=Pediculus humanus subsp. corporis TaxID=121224 RepID=E0VKY2_PEDHC|nr:5-azacytidine resistance protein azr1, putative [Pediculus humanus corporis]EEB14038.1 5-azacytidine resistance protein azr1, putative [Pediculus humanus corporis]
MHSLIWTGRVLSRALWSSITNDTHALESNVNRKRDSHLVSAVCGFPKDFFFSALRKGKFGDDAWFSAKYKTADVIGVADGVGGWRQYGIDAGEFSSFLMQTCERLVTKGRFLPTDPADLLAKSYYELFETKQAVLGSSTACIVILNKENSMIYTANIGDSGFVIVRQGQVVHRSEEQLHYFNTPFQLSLPPPDYDVVLNDRPESADQSNFPVEDGDVILVATDGVFDNVPDSILITELVKLQGEKDPIKIQCVANTIAWMARNLAFDSSYMSPFAINARKNGIDVKGWGKPDDITVLLATVAI